MPGSDRGKALAEDVQASLNDALGADGSARSEDLYVLRSGSQPCVLVECGFLSNAEEEQKLQQADYQQQVAKAICDGAVAYLSGE
jgi:N-acetylmuramoyl-L-alanine amidase